MNGKDIKEFFETLIQGEEMEFVYKDEHFFIQDVNNGENKKKSSYSVVTNQGLSCIL